MSQYDPVFDLIINVGHCDLYFAAQWFCLISWRLFDVWTSYLGLWVSMTPTFDLKINVGNYGPYFMVQWFCLISWRLFDVWTSYLGIMSQYDMTFDLEINVGQPTFHGPMILPFILKTIWCMDIIPWDYESVWHDIWPQNKCWSTYISWSSDFALYLEDYLMYEHHT